MRIRPLQKILFLFFFLKSSLIYGQKVGVVHEYLSYYINQNKELFWLSDFYETFNTSQGKYTTFNNPTKSNLTEKVAKVINRGGPILVLTEGGNLWAFEFSKSRDRKLKIQPILVDSSGTNIDVVTFSNKGRFVVTKKDGYLYAANEMSLGSIALCNLLFNNSNFPKKDHNRIKDIAIRILKRYPSKDDIIRAREFEKSNPKEFYSNNFNNFKEEFKYYPIDSLSRSILESKKDLFNQFIKDYFINSPLKLTDTYLQTLIRKYQGDMADPYENLYSNLGLKADECIINNSYIIKKDSSLWEMDIDVRSYANVINSFELKLIDNQKKWVGYNCEGEFTTIISKDGTISNGKYMIVAPSKETTSENYWKQLVRKSDLKYYGVKNDGTIWYMGNNDEPIVSALKPKTDTVFTQIGKDTDWVKFLVINGAAFALKKNGKLYCWGYNNPTISNYFLNTKIESITSPTPILPEIDFQDFSINNRIVLAITKDNEFYYWGGGSSDKKSFKKEKIYEINTIFNAKKYDLTYNKELFLSQDSIISPDQYLIYNDGTFSEFKNESGKGSFLNSIPERDYFSTINTKEAQKLFKNPEKIYGKNLSSFYYKHEGNVYYYFGEISGRLSGPHGYGLLYCTDGSIYEGNFLNGMKEGFGIVNYGNEYDTSSQVSVIGAFSKNELSGLAKKVWGDGESIQGSWTNNKISMAEVYIPNAAGTFIGSVEYKHDEAKVLNKSINMNGRSMLVYNNGDSLIGEFYKGSVSEKGILKTKDYIYEGDFQDNAFSGSGIQKFIDGKIIVGTWEKNKKTGEFTETAADGSKMNSFWNSGKLLATDKDPLYNKLKSMPTVLRNLYLIDNGNFYNSLKKSFIAGSGSITSFGGNLLPDVDGIYICNLSAGASGNRYSTKNCISLETFEVRGNYIGLLFTGTISKIKENSTIRLVQQPNGKYERKIVTEGQIIETMRVSLNIVSTLQGNFRDYTICFMNDSGRQDCGQGNYNGKIVTQK
jgi:hypothetical protein